MSSRRALFLGLLTWAAYISLRTLFQRLFPSPPSELQAYLIQDSAITVLRAASALAFYLIVRARWKNPASGLSGWRMAGPWSWFAATVMLSGGLTACLAQAANPSAPAFARALEAAIALVVALNEELAFRGLFYNAGRELVGRKAAVWLGALLFCATHLGYQPLFHLPQVFFVGLCLGVLRDRGLSLPSLILIHFIFDSFNALLLPSPPLQTQLYALSVLLTALAALLAFEAEARPSGAGMELLFAYGTLKRGQPEAARLNLEGRADWLGAALLPEAALYDLGAYPAAAPSRAKGDSVTGELWAIRDAQLLKELDDYEGVEYLRDRMTAKMGREDREAWVYVLAGGIGGRKTKLKLGIW